MRKLPLVLLVGLLAGLLGGITSAKAQEPGSRKELRPSDAVNDASGTGQLFECIHVPGLTDVVEGLNGFAVADIDSNGYLDVLTLRTPPFNVSTFPPRDSVCDSINFTLLPDYQSFDKLRIMLNQGDWVFEELEIKLTGTPATADNFSQGRRGAQIPVLSDFNNDGRYDIFVGRQPVSMSKGQLPSGVDPIGCSLLLGQDSLGQFRDVSDQLGAQNKLAYNRQVSLADVNADGWLDIALGADNVAGGFEGLPDAALYVYQPGGNSFTDGQYQDIGGTPTAPDFGDYVQDPAKDKAGPNIVLRDADNDGDIDLFQSCHILPSDGPPFLQHWPGEYRQGVWTWQNRLEQSGSLQLAKDTANGLAQEARMAFDTATQKLVRMNPADSAAGLAYLVFGDVNNDGQLDALAFDTNDPSVSPTPQDVSAQFWYNQGGFSWQEATDSAGLGNLNDTYIQWYQFFQQNVIPPMLAFQPQPRASQPGLQPMPYGRRNAYHADAAFADFNNDGWQDLVVLDRRQQENIVDKRTKLYMNDGDGTFTRKPTTFSGIDASGISCEAVDFNNDGLLDLLISGDPDNSGMPCHAEAFEDKVYLNTGHHGADDNHWLRLRFAGATPAELIGARVEIFDPVSGQLEGMRGLYTNHTYKSSGPLEAHFGLGQDTCVDLKVTLPSGSTFTKQCVQADQYLTYNLPQDSLTTVREPNASGGPHNGPRLRLYPNPATRELHLSAGQPLRSVTLLNSQGKPVRRLRPGARNVEVGLKALSAGVYHVIAQTRTGQWITRSFIVE
jgi:hypothetical protein